MQKILLVDGYNIIYSWKSLKKISDDSLEAARDKLMEILADYQGYTNQRVIIVFDAYNVKGIGQVYKYNKNIDVIYTKEAETADQYIEKATLEARGTYKYAVRVATSDYVEQVIILGAGATRISARELEQEVKRAKTKGRKYLASDQPIKNNPLENWMDESVREKMESLRRGQVD